jgi:hypothetical protein
MQKKDDINEMICELASDIYFYFIHRLDIRNKCIVDVDDYTENTDLGREIYYMIEDTIMKSIKKPENPNEKWNLFDNRNLMKEIKEYVISKDKNKLH